MTRSVGPAGSDRRGGRIVARRRYVQTTIYLTREFFFSFLVAFLFFFFIFFINQMLLLAEDILTRQVPFMDVVRLIIYSMPSIVALSFPFGSLVGALMTVGRLASDNEIIAFRASGIPNRRLFIPMVVLGIVFSLVSFVMNDYFLPLGTINFGKLYRDLIFSNPELELESYTVKNYENTIIVTGEVSDRTIEDVVILDNTEGGEQRVITADRALLAESGGDAGVVTLELTDVATQTFDPPARGDYEYSRAGGMQYNILLKDITFSIRNPGPREMSSYDVWQVIRDRRETLATRRADQSRVVAGLRFRLADAYYGGVEQFLWGQSTVARLANDLEALSSQVTGEAAREVTDRTLQNYEIEFYKKFSIPAACLVFVVFAFPTGLLTRRAGRAVGFGIGLLMSTAYWSMLIAGQTLGGNNPQFPAVIAMWYPNIVVLLLGLVALLWRSRR